MEHERRMSESTATAEAEMNTNDELEYAARAGIHLLEENSQLLEEIYHLKNQIQHVESEKGMLKYLLKERNDNIEKLTVHLRESLVESQNVLSELNQAKIKIVTLEERIVELQPSSSPSKLSRRHSSHPNSPPRSLYERCKQKDAEQHQGNTSPSRLSPVKQNHAGALDNEFMFKNDLSVQMAHDRNRLLTLLREAETKFDEEHKQTITLKSENKSFQKRISELKPLQVTLLDTENELKKLQEKLEEYKKNEAITLEERKEERALINSLRNTVELYQRESMNQIFHYDGTISLHEIKNDHEDPVLRSDPYKRQDKSIHVEVQADNPQAIQAALDKSNQLQIENERLNKRLVELNSELANTKSLLVSNEQEQTQSQNHDNEPEMDTTENGPSFRDEDIYVLRQKNSTLQELLQHFKTESELVNSKVVHLSKRNATYFRQIETLKMLVANQSKQHLSNNTCSQWEDCPAFQVETNETSFEEKSEMTWSILRRLLNNWSSDKSKRMSVVDWIMHLTCNTGKYKPLLIDSLGSTELSEGFEFVFVYLLKDVLNINFSVAKRERMVKLTDIKVEIHENRKNSTIMSERIHKLDIHEILDSLYEYEASIDNH